MKILKIIGIVVVAIIVIVLIYASMQPSEGKLERSIVIERPAEMVYEQVSVMKNFNNWSPWFTIDPDTKYTYEGPEGGVGAKMSWQSEHPEVGEGSQWIIDAEENKEVHLELDFGFQGGYYSDVYLAEMDQGTEVTWTYRYEDLGLMSAFFVGMMDAETMVGDSYEQGLIALKKHVEDQPLPEPEVIEEEIATDSTLVEE